jgi:hypothetical protein
LRRPVRLDGSACFWRIGRDADVPAEVEALALASPPAVRASYLVGLWTPEFGYLHTGVLGMYVEPRGHWRATATVELTGRYNAVAGTATGPYQGTSHLDVTPAPQPGSPWPFA